MQKGIAMADVTRREFLKVTGATLAGSSLVLLGFSPTAALAEVREFKLSRATETRNTCPYCAVACGVLMYSLGDRAKNAKSSIFHIEGDPDHPINRGTLCPKGITLKDDIQHVGRLTTPKVRRAGSDKWEEISWDEALKGISRHIKETRDRTFVAKNAKGETVNRAPGIAWIGGCTDTSEFNYLQWRVITAFGVPYRDSQARV